MTETRSLILLSCLAAIIASEASSAASGVHPLPLGEPRSVERFVADFDRNIQNAPIAADIVSRDPVFRARVLQATSDAYAAGGWSAADDALDTLLLEKQPEITWAVIHADDALLVALWRQDLRRLRQLAGQPADCAYYVGAGRGSAVSLPTQPEERKAAVTAATAAYRSGLANLLAQKAPALPSETAAAALLAKSAALGAAYSEEERAALGLGKTHIYRPASDEVACAAKIKLYENVLTLPEAEAAALIRDRWGGWLAVQRDEGEG